MSSKKILIDSTRSNNRVVVVDDKNIIEEFDFESSDRKLIKNNIYLCKVTRVEYSLQAAFIDYGGEKNGFLPFSEIHPDYYQIPASDRSKLIEELKREQERGNEFEENYTTEEKKSDNIDQENQENDLEEDDYNSQSSQDEQDDINSSEYDNIANKHYLLYKKYKIQEVIKRGQNLLVQVSKDERGNKGVSLTTYISLAGRYCVLMPNSPKSTGISRKIVNIQERKRLKAILDSLQVPAGTSVVIRTAGGNREQEEFKRDYNYLVSLWNEIREKTLSSKAPSMIYSEDDIIKQIIRDMYDSSVSEIVIEGEKSYSSTVEFARHLIPGHEHKIKLYKDKVPIFHKYNIEQQIEELFCEKVYLRSGAYLVINQTEALVAIDVNSGRSTQERNIEDTATRTNLEAAREIARQLRLRDLAGLIVIDFIDMLDVRNRKAVERELRDALSSDKAKVQLSRISPFGLLELSRQRLRSSFIDVSTSSCSHCNGSGKIKSLETIFATILSNLEREIMGNHRSKVIEVSCAPEVAIYALNYKRSSIANLEKEGGERIFFTQDNNFGREKFTIAHKNDLSNEEIYAEKALTSDSTVNDGTFIERKYAKRPNRRDASYSKEPREQDRREDTNKGSREIIRGNRDDRSRESYRSSRVVREDNRGGREEGQREGNKVDREEGSRENYKRKSNPDYAKNRIAKKPLADSKYKKAEDEPKPSIKSSIIESIISKLKKK